MQLSEAIGPVGSKQPHLAGCRARCAECGMIVRRQFAVEMVFRFEEAENFLDLLGDFAAAAHALAEFRVVVFATMRAR